MEKMLKHFHVNCKIESLPDLVLIIPLYSLSVLLVTTFITFLLQTKVMKTQTPWIRLKMINRILELLLNLQHIQTVCEVGPFPITLLSTCSKTDELEVPNNSHAQEKSATLALKILHKYFQVNTSSRDKSYPTSLSWFLTL